MSNHQPETAQPSHKALESWIQGILGHQCSISEITQLPGATSSALYRISLTGQGQPKNLVLRCFTHKGWLQAEPDLVQHEAASLRMASRLQVPTPELVAFDQNGSVTGHPAILMTELPGRVQIQPADPQNWLDQMAEALAQIHALPLGAQQDLTDSFPWRYRTYNDVHRLAAPAWSQQQALWRKALRVAQSNPPAAPVCFIHRDYHPCNLLWQQGRVSGIVDWVNACLGPAGIDLGHCRLNLALLHGVEVADQFLDTYQVTAGSTFSYEPYWDLLSLLEFLPGPPEVYPGWVTFGVTGLTDSMMAERLEAYLISLMARL